MLANSRLKGWYCSKGVKAIASRILRSSDLQFRVVCRHENKKTDYTEIMLSQILLWFTIELLRFGGLTTQLSGDRPKVLKQIKTHFS
ncbi:hypothetical protein [Nostoc sp. WHI]|uniref:hypothetical protein n=1 Tax=Nostoc sp. WHI TaxID=2650611 RepID=UPI0018C6D015|nr:hypothetical protein [Nostoc sp. WHI]MBG1271008.1 hypothetical protein [Nostoc sp. WHI]